MLYGSPGNIKRPRTATKRFLRQIRDTVEGFGIGIVPRSFTYLFASGLAYLCIAGIIAPMSALHAPNWWILPAFALGIMIVLVAFLFLIVEIYRLGILRWPSEQAPPSLSNSNKALTLTNRTCPGVRQEESTERRERDRVASPRTQNPVQHWQLRRRFHGRRGRGANRNLARALTCRCGAGDGTLHRG